MLARWLCVGSVILAVSGCDKPTSGDATAAPSAQAATVSVAAATAPATSGSAASSASPAGSVPSAAGSAETAGGTYSGSFKSKVGQVVTPKDAHIKVWGNDPGTDMLGDETITLRVSGAGERRTVIGEGKGTFGDLLIAGELDGKSLQARVDPKNPNAPNAMTGVLQGTLEGGAITATLRVASRNANIVREAESKLQAGP